MEKFTKIKSVPAYIPLMNIDTDKIIPKQFLKTIKRSGLGKSLFYEMRFDETGNPIGDDRDSARMLAGMIKQINQNIQKTYSITKPFVTSLPKVKNFSHN